MNSCLIFLHIPKTAGTTFRTLLESEHSPEQTLQFYEPTHDLMIRKLQLLQAMSPEARSQLRLVEGHFAFGLHRWLSQSFHYVTFLRDPVERAISFFQHVMRSPDHYLHRTHDLSKMDLDQFLERRYSAETENGQVLYLSGAAGVGAVVDAKRTSLTELYELAHQNIHQHFRFVGLTHLFDESVTMLKAIFGWKAPYESRNRAERPSRVSDLSPRVLTLLRERNRFDQMLYDDAAEKFERLRATFR